MITRQQAGIVGLSALLVGAVIWLIPSNPRKKIIKIALKEVGKPKVLDYWLDTTGGTGENKDWCGVFILWVLHQAGLAKTINWEIGKGFIYRLPVTLIPKPGDIAYYTKNQHQALVASVNGDMITTINGNDKNQSVSLSKPFSKSLVTAFYSIERLLK